MVDLKPEVRDFLARNFDSVEAIRIASLLQRSPDTFWTEQAIAQQLSMPIEVVHEKVAALTTSNILKRGEQTRALRFAPVAEKASLASEVLCLYGEASDLDPLYKHRDR